MKNEQDRNKKFKWYRNFLNIHITRILKILKIKYKKQEKEEEKESQFFWNARKKVLKKPEKNRKEKTENNKGIREINKKPKK